MGTTGYFDKEFICPGCGKKFLIPFYVCLETYAYKLKINYQLHYCCGWNCLCEAKRKKAKKKSR